MATASYADELKVKISEKYKPPCKISLPVTYSQRLALNKQLLDSTPDYDFGFETSVVEKMRELKNARMAQMEEREKRMADARKMFEERIVMANKEERETVCYKQAGQNHILTPSLAPTYSTILTPVPLTNHEPSKSLIEQRKPFNISDFETDTSSPFDNMELKSINDLEVLAQVLKNDGYSQKATTSYVAPAVSAYSHVNGYYCQPSAFGAQQTNEYRSVPDIMKSLERELNSTHINNASKSRVTSSTETRGLMNPLDALPKDQQALCQSIGSMGFPLDRVARVCQTVGGDYKKIVEHLLALSELLDLGFSERDASKALLLNGNNRDKALDELIS
ncbi:uncharacterized protein LOC132702118 [Cylas formicarius]|uniref:uncharacterized protein LOC132702118 n=1 Tax=Cylas formicarius TaxID=197179 RepID=UPI00295879FD|nr:uncharacterized protein LOC132702118 [Cylas formicarius]